MRRASIATVYLAAAVAGSSPAALASSGADIQGVAQVGGKPQANVVVWVDVPGALTRADSKPVLDQRNFDFNPRVLAVQVGSVVEFPNHDRVFHNVFSFHDGKKFDLGLYPTGTMKLVTFDKPGLSRIFCNIHPHMVAYVMAVASPYFAVSDEAGRFTIRDVPPGNHPYQAWRSGGSTIGGTASSNSETVLAVRWP